MIQNLCLPKSHLTTPFARIKFRLSSTGQSCFIECDMFYVELELHAVSGQVREVKIQHEADQTSPPQVSDTAGLRLPVDLWCGPFPRP